MRIAGLYVLFAAIAVGVNLGTQLLLNALIESPYAVYIALLVGTVVGLVCKYLLDKRWVFDFTSQPRSREARALLLYTLFSAVMTLVFWGFELGARYIFGSALAQYIGGAIGLTIGYVSKYWLDREVTFRIPDRGAAS